RHAGRFAYAGRTQNGEVLGQHFLDVDIGNHRAVLLQRADIDLVRAARGVDGAQLLGGNEVDGIADGRIVGAATLEFRLAAAKDLTEQVDAGMSDVLVGRRQV